MPQLRVLAYRPADEGEAVTGEEAYALIAAGRTVEVVGYRRIGTAALVSPKLDGYVQYGVFGTKPAKLAVFQEGHLDFSAKLTPPRPHLLEHVLNHPNSAGRGRRWVPRDGYLLYLADHRPRYDGHGGVNCRCGWSRQAPGHGLARLEFTIHTSNLAPQRA